MSARPFPKADRVRRRQQIIGLAAAALTLAGCELAPLQPQPPAATAPSSATAMELMDPVSRELADYYQRVQDGFLAQGLLRTDGGGPDTPFSRSQLVENFIRIALFEEYTNDGGRLVARQSPSRLHRWEQPINMQLVFGDSVPDDHKRTDRDNVANFSTRLSRISGVPIRMVSQGANFHVFFLSENERRAMGPTLRRIVPGISDTAVRTVTDLPRSSYCLVFAFDSNNDNRYSQAVAIIRSEHPDLLRLSCIHEEIAQGLGLSNDSPAARPSIFNDDEEFGLLTTHDEFLLRMLYDPRMRAGMDAAQARAVANVIAGEYFAGDS